MMGSKVNDLGRVPLAPGSREPSPTVSAASGVDPSRGPVRTEIERQCSEGAGKCSYDAECHILSVSADLDIGTLERLFSGISPEAFERAPKHHYWGAGDPNCPADIKAANGELHTMRCWVCELDNPRNPICHADAMFERAAQAIEARRAATGTGAVHESAVACDAPNPTTDPNTPHTKGGL